MATRVIDDSKLQDIAVAIQSKDNGGQMTVDQMAGRIENIPSGSDFDMTVTANQIKMLVYIHPEIMHCYVNFIQTVANGVEVDWGDGTPVNTSSATGQDRYSCASIAHDYSTTGYKIIKMTVKQGTVSLIESNGCISFAGADGNTNGNQFPNNYYRHSLVGIVFGDNTSGNVGQCRALSFVHNFNGSVGGNSALTDATIRDSATVLTGVDGTSIRNIKIPSSVKVFYDNCFRNCTYLGVVDFTDYTIYDLSQCTFGATMFVSATSNGLVILFKDQETADYAKTITNLSVWASYIKYVGEVEN